MVAVLTPKSGGKSIVIDKAVVLVGRHPDCDYILQNSRKVSRRHVCIVQVNEKYMVRDLGSMNGVCVNGTRVKNEQRISIGDEVAIGDVLFRFEEIQKIPRPPRKEVTNGVATASAPPEQPDESLSDDLVTDEPLISPAMDDPDVSQEYPVAIPDQDQSFAVVESASEVEVVPDNNSFFDEDEPLSDDVPELFDEAVIVADEPLVVLPDEPSANAQDQDDAELLSFDDDVDFESIKVIEDEPGAVEVVEVLDEIDIIDTVEESSSSNKLAESYDEFEPIIEIVDEFDQYDDLDDGDVEDVILLDE